MSAKPKKDVHDEIDKTLHMGKYDDEPVAKPVTPLDLKIMRLEMKKQALETKNKEKKPRRHIRWRGRKKPEKQQPLLTEIPDIPDVMEEQMEKEYTTLYCPESVTDIKTLRDNPEEYLEINIIKKSRVVDTFAIPIDAKKFHYKDKEFRIIEECIYLLPTKQGLLMPTSFYREGRPEPTGFKNTNKGITGKALSLLYMEQLYTSLLYAEDTKYNLFIVILLIACLIAFGVGCYFVFMHGGGMIQPSQPLVTGG